MTKIKYILTHPIQYQVPLIRYLTTKGIDLTVLYRSNFNLNKHLDKGFKKKISWSTNLLGGYKYKFLSYIGKNQVNNLYPITTNFYKDILDRNTDIIFLHGIKTWYNIIIIFLAKIFNKKVFVREEFHKYSKYRNNLNILINKFFFKIIDPFIDIYLAIGSKNRQYYIENSIDKKKIVPMPYVVDNKIFYQKRTNKIGEKIKLLYAGKLIKRKGINILLKSILLLNQKKRVKNKFELTIVGDGYMKNELSKFISLNRLDNVKIIAFKNEKDLAKIYKKTDIFIMPSYYEPWGLTVNEALASQNAVICSNKVGSSFDLVKNEFNGYKFKEKNYKDLASKMYILISNRKKLQKFKNNGLKIISKWSFRECYEGINKAIRKVSNQT